MAPIAWESDRRSRERPHVRQGKLSPEPVLLRKEQRSRAGGAEVGRACREGKRRRMEPNSQEDLTSQVK